MNTTSNFQNSKKKSKEKIKKNLLKTIKQSDDSNITNIKTISKIRIKNLGKRRDRSLINSKRAKNESPMGQTLYVENISKRVKDKSNLREINRTTIYDDSSDSSENIQNTFPNIGRHAGNS